MHGVNLLKIATHKTFFAMALLATLSCAQRDLKPLTPCVQSAVSKAVPPRIDKVDLLFAIDGSNSMVEENKLLAAQLPRLVLALTKGERNPGSGVQDFTPVKDLHIGMITVDMGVNGAEYDGGWIADAAECVAKIPADRPYSRFIDNGGQKVNLGNDGILWNIINKNAKYGSSATSCSGISLSGNDRFLSFVTTGNAATDGAAAINTANQFSCLSQLLVGDNSSKDPEFWKRLSCGFEQQLEAILKATYPYDDQNVPTKSKITFFQGTKGHADYTSTAGLSAPTSFQSSEPPPLNAGFFRKDALLAIVLVSDEDDCSVARNIPYDGNGEPIGPMFSGYLNFPSISSRPVSFQEVLCTRAAEKLEKDPKSGLLHSIDRYVNGLLAAKDPSLLLFSAIVGLPIDNDAQALYKDTAKQDLSGILAHPKMQYVEKGVECDQFCDEPNQTDRIAREFACGAAYPGRRYVKLAQKLKENKANAVVWPICEASFDNAINVLVDEISKIVDAQCLPRPKTVASDGSVKCDVFETLGVNEKCSGIPGRELVKKDDQGREICRVKQVPQTNRSGALQACDATSGDNCGWFYDDFTVKDQLKPGDPGVAGACKPTPTRTGAQRVTFTNNAEPKDGRSTRFECYEAAQSVPAQGVDSKIGDSCAGSNSDACGAELICVCPSGDNCQPSDKSCQKACTTDAQCPGGYVCDTSKPQPFCVNPICG